MPISLDAITPIVNKVLSFIPDPQQREAARQEAMKIDNQRDMQNEANRYSAITAEGSSEDKWTSRARPTFLYVVYFLIVSAVPMGFISYFSPDAALAVTEGFNLWLSAIPDQLYVLMGVGYSGYAIVRTVDKRKTGN